MRLLFIGEFRFFFTHLSSLFSQSVAHHAGVGVGVHALHLLELGWLVRGVVSCSICPVCCCIMYSTRFCSPSRWVRKSVFSTVSDLHYL